MSAPIHVVTPWLAASNVARVRRCACGGVELCVERVRLHLSEEELVELSDTLDVAVRRLRAGDDGELTMPRGASA
jgi:hypothetical protein